MAWGSYRHQHNTYADVRAQLRHPCCGRYTAKHPAGRIGEGERVLRSKSLAGRRTGRQVPIAGLHQCSPWRLCSADRCPRKQCVPGIDSPIIRPAPFRILQKFENRKKKLTEKVIGDYMGAGAVLANPQGVSKPPTKLHGNEPKGTLLIFVM